jgi:hypothetical protein
MQSSRQFRKSLQIATRGARETNIHQQFDWFVCLIDWSACHLNYSVGTWKAEYILLENDQCKLGSNFVEQNCNMRFDKHFFALGTGNLSNCMSHKSIYRGIYEKQQIFPFDTELFFSCRTEGPMLFFIYSFALPFCDLWDDREPRLSLAAILTRMFSDERKFIDPIAICQVPTESNPRTPYHEELFA